MEKILKFLHFIPWCTFVGSSEKCSLADNNLKSTAEWKFYASASIFYLSKYRLPKKNRSHVTKTAHSQSHIEQKTHLCCRKQQKNKRSSVFCLCALLTWPDLRLFRLQFWHPEKIFFFFFLTFKWRLLYLYNVLKFWNFSIPQKFLVEMRTKRT